MTEKANPSRNRPAEAFKTAGAIAYGGHGSGGFVVDGSNPTDISTQDSGITEADLNAFDETSDGDSLDVTIDGGEAFVFGSWIAIDTDTTVSLDASTDGQTVYVGWNKNGADDVIVGLAADFSDASGDSDERIPLWTFDTDGSGVTDATDDRRIGYSIEVEGEATFGQNADVTVEYDSANDEISLSGADLVVNGLTLMDESQNFIPQASLENDDITVSAGTSLSGGGDVDLGGSVTISHSETSSQGDVSAGSGEAITDIDLNPEGHVTNIGTTDFDGRFVKESGDTMSGSLTIGGDLTATNGETIWDESATYIPQSRLENDSVTINSGTDLSGGGGVSLGGSVTLNHADTSSQGDVAADAGAAITDIDLNAQGHVTNIGTTDFDSRFVLESGDTMTGGLTIGGDLNATDGETIWDDLGKYIPQGRLQSDSVTINAGDDLDGGGRVTLGGSVTLNHDNTSSQGNVSTGGSTVIDDIDLDGNGHVTNLDTENRSLNDWNVPSDFNINSASRFGLPTVSSDPSANPGDMWYRSDLD